MAVDMESTWLRRYVTQAPPRLRLLCLPHAGGSAAFFHPWGHAFGDDVEVLAARYPGRQERIADPFVTAMEPLADVITDELRPFLDAPLAIFGHSMGASLAYEITLRLQARYGVEPVALLVSGRRPPHLLSPRPELTTDDEVVAEVRRLGGTDSAVLDHPDLRELVLPAIRADFGIVAGYPARPGLPMPCPVTAYVGDRDVDADVEAVRGWEELAPNGFDLCVLPGDHFYLIEQRAPLIADIRTRLAPGR
ncbi:thioesterase [Streptomyces sp. SCA3-4]|uniref:thioesterase II family protein n=1 Tax=Streptomyces sichuanensis TaxID=2871810 RepID=UPI001CE2E2A0|nr:thioesterase domain-containing protein [Streptomyces sichuanensis]MCA6094688.1 thioesterase [Streptomyces sichuanensis]